MIDTSSTGRQDYSAAAALRSDVDAVIAVVHHKSTTDEDVVVSRNMPSVDNNIDNTNITATTTDDLRRGRSGSLDSSQMNYSTKEQVSPSTVRDRRAAKTMDLIRKYEEQKRRWQEHRPFQQLQNHHKQPPGLSEVNNNYSGGGTRNNFTKGSSSSSSSMNDVADPFITAHTSTTMPTMPPAEMMTRKQRLELEFESDDNDEAASVENDDDDKERLANDIFFNNVVNSVTYDEYDGYAASESRSFTDGTTTDIEQLSPDWKRSLDGNAKIDNINFANRRRIQSKDNVSLADNISVGTSLTSLSRLSAPGSMEGVKEIQPLGGPKYYVMVNTKKGQAKIVHEGMPAAGREGFKMAMEEKGFEIIEYDLLPGKHQHNKKSNGNQLSSSPRSMSAPKARSNDVRTMDYDAFIAGVSDESCGSVTSMFVTPVMSNTKRGQVINGVANNDAMPNTTSREGLKLAMEEEQNGYAAVHEYDEAGSPSLSPTNHGDMSKMRKLNPRDGNSDEVTGGGLTKKKTKESTRSRRAVESLLRPKVDTFQSWLENEFNNVLDVADRIDNVITGGCSMSNQEVFDDGYGTDCGSRTLTFDSETDMEYNDRKSSKRHSNNNGSSGGRRRNIKSGRTPRRRRRSPSWHSDDETYLDDEETDINDHDINYNIGTTSRPTPRGNDKSDIRPTRSKSEEPYRTMVV